METWLVLSEMADFSAPHLGEGLTPGPEARHKVTFTPEGGVSH